MQEQQLEKRSPEGTLLRNSKHEKIHREALAMENIFTEKGLHPESPCKFSDVLRLLLYLMIPIKRPQSWANSMRN